MKKYITMDFDEKGAPVMGQAKNTPANMAFIPTTWAPPAPVQEGSGLKSISISPVLETTPALDTVFPVYWDADTAVEGWNEANIALTTETPLTIGAEYNVTITPTSDWTAGHTGSDPMGVGEPLTYTVTLLYDGELPFGECWVSNSDDSNGIAINAVITNE